MPAAPPAPPPAAAPPAPAPAPAAPPPAPTGTPMDRAKARMAAGAVEADLSDPNPLETVRQKKAAPLPEPPKPAEPPKPSETPPTTDELGLESDELPKPEPKKDDQPPKPGDETITDEELKSSKPPKQAGPWKLKAYWEKRAATVEQQNAELKERLSKLPNIERLESIQKRNQELEEEIRYQNYAKSEEFAKNHQKPYEEAWAKAVSDLGQLEVLAEDGSVARKATASDLIALANMPLGEARKTANAMFGDSANDVMFHRQRIKDLSDAQNKALEDARKSSSERQEQFALNQQTVVKEVATLWERFNTEDVGKYEFLKSREGDEEWNGKLAKAQSLVDTAFSQNATDPSLTPEQRAKAVRSHAAVRNRAIAYSSLKLENSRLKAQIKERDDKLKQYEQSEPTGGSAGGTNGKPAPAATPMERARQRLQAASVPAPAGYY